MLPRTQERIDHDLSLRFQIGEMPKDLVVLGLKCEFITYEYFQKVFLESKEPIPQRLQNRAVELLQMAQENSFFNENCQVLKATRDGPTKCQQRNFMRKVDHIRGTLVGVKKISFSDSGFSKTFAPGELRLEESDIATFNFFIVPIKELKELKEAGLISEDNQISEGLSLGQAVDLYEKLRLLPSKLYRTKGSPYNELKRFNTNWSYESKNHNQVKFMQAVPKTADFAFNVDRIGGIACEALGEKKRFEPKSESKNVTGLEVLIENPFRVPNKKQVHKTSFQPYGNISARVIMRGEEPEVALSEQTQAEPAPDSGGKIPATE